MQALMTLLFATTGGLVLSGIVANLYRLLARQPKGAPQRVFYLGVMLLAGPSVLIDNATRSYRNKDCSNAAYALAMALTFYWSLALGLLAITLAWRNPFAS
jgi:hypothetical protein